MANRDIVTNRQLYEAIQNIERKIDEIVKERITPLEVWRGEIMGKLAVFGSVFILGANLFIDWLKERFRI